MDTREAVLERIKSLQNSSIICQLATGYGKTRCAIEFMKKRVLPFKNNKILIVVPRLVLIDTWKLELVKWDAKDYLKDITFSTYVSLPKHTDVNWSMVIFDECHHMSDRCFEAFDSMRYKYFVGLSATIKYETEKAFKDRLFDLRVIKVSLSDAINNEVIPDPKVLLVPLALDNSKIKHYFNKTAVTEKGYYDRISAIINQKKQILDTSYNAGLRKYYLHQCGERLMFLSDIKVPYTKQILEQIKDFQALIFCSTIAEAEKVGCHSINSKQPKSYTAEILNRFNIGNIKHISSIGMLDEGVNLKTCQIGIFNRLNNSEIKVIQKNGRILRHENPFIIIPYFQDTWEEVLMRRMLKNYTSGMITLVDNINNIKSYIQ
jgi:superfamily II DNA or RNA helicase